MSSSGGGFTQELMFFSHIPLEIIPGRYVRDYYTRKDSLMEKLKVTAVMKTPFVTGVDI